MKNEGFHFCEPPPRRKEKDPSLLMSLEDKNNAEVLGDDATKTGIRLTYLVLYPATLA